MKFLFLEDNKFDADLVTREILKGIPNAAIDKVSTISEARAALEKKNGYQVVLLDINLPDGNGLEVLIDIREKQLPIAVIVLTGSGDEEQAVIALKSGADDYFIKGSEYFSKLPNVILHNLTELNKKHENTNRILHVLYVEHHESDIDLTIRHFKKHAPHLKIDAVASAKEVLKKLDKANNGKTNFHILLVDYNLPGIDAIGLVKIIRQDRKLDIPIIMVTGQGNEDIAIQALKLGVDEYLVKRENYINRLPSLIESAYQHKFIRRQKQDLQESEKRYRLLAENSGDVIFTLDMDLNHIYISPSVSKLNGYTPEELIRQNIKQTLTPESYNTVINILTEVLNIHDAAKQKRYEPVVLELEMFKKDKSTIWTEVKASILFDDYGEPNGILGVTRDITERKLAEEALFRSREEYRMFFEDDLTGDFIATVEGKLLNCNPAYINILGFKNKYEALRYDSFKLYKTPNVRNNIIKKLEKNGRLINYEYDLIRVDGKLINVVGNIVGIFNPENKLVSFKGYIIDITETKLATEELRKLSRAVEQSPVSIMIADTKGNIEYVNPRFSSTSGYSSNEIMGKNPRFLKSMYKTQQEYKELWDTIKSGRDWTGEFYNKRKDGSYFWELASISSIKDKNGKITHYLAVKEDITQKKKYEMELIEAKEKAEESDRLKTSFLQNISHEIRTPMNGIMGFTNLLKNTFLSPEKRKKYLNIINQSGERMLNTIQDIIEMSKIQIGQYAVNVEQINIQDLLQALYNFYLPKAKEKKLDLRYVNHESKPTIIKTDETKLNGILNNLLQNAIKYTNKGFIDFGFKIKPSEIEFYVSDSGIGIPQEMHTTIFERFVKVNPSYNSDFEGSGLGLSIAKAYIDMLGGKIWVEPNTKRGSVFYFTIPDERIEKIDLPSAEEIPEFNLKGKTILVAEDDEYNSFYLRELLDSANVQVITANNGQEAVDQVKAVTEIDLILMDIKMPRLDGHKAREIIKTIRPDLPVIAQTGYTIEDPEMKVILSVFDDFITKPIGKQELMKKIKTILNMD